MFDKGGEILKLDAATAVRHSGVAAHALGHVSLEADALLLAIVADVDAGILLLGDHMGDRGVHFAVHFGLVEGLARFALDQQFGQFGVARQAADMGRENAVFAGQHGKVPLARRPGSAGFQSGRAI